MNMLPVSMNPFANLEAQEVTKSCTSHQTLLTETGCQVEEYVNRVREDDVSVCMEYDHE